MNLLFTVCGRDNSKGVRNKIMRDFLGYPLFLHTLSTLDLFARKHGEDYDRIDIAVNTDCEPLLDIINVLKSEYVIVERRPEFAGDNAPKVPVIADCLAYCRQLQHDYDFIVDIDITAPLTPVSDIEGIIMRAANYEKRYGQKADVIFSVTEARRNPYFNMVKREGGKIYKVIESNYLARQQAPEIYDMNAALYAYSPSFLERRGVNSPFDGTCDIYVMPDSGILDIDTETNFELMQILAEHFYKARSDIKEKVDHIPEL